jgi:hypothetical protein
VLTKSSTFSIHTCLVLVFAVTLATPAEAQTPGGLQATPIILKASQVLPGNILSGPGYQIEPSVENDGFVNIYRLTTDYGPLRVESTALLMERINEMKALRHMDELKQTKAYGEALKEGVKAPLRTAKGVVTEPVDTAKGVATGIGRWFSDVGRSIVSDDPHQENVLKTAIGYSSVKRKYAFEYGIDPYTGYEPVQEKLSELARASVAGGLTPKIAFGFLKRPAATVLRVTSTSDTMRKLVRDKSPAELEKINEEKLKAMGVPDAVAKDFIDNPHYNPQETTLLVGELDSMKGIEGQAKFIAAAAQAGDESIARFMRFRAQMMGDYHANIRPAVRIVDVNGSPFLQRKDGVIVGLFPLDHVAWTADLERKERSAAGALKNIIGVKGKELWIAGTVDPVARNALESRGWRVTQDIRNKLRKK